MILAVLLLAAAPATEDAAHRADRLRTEQLNRMARDAVEHRAAGNDSAERHYAAARARYQAALAAWHRRVAACEGGESDACEDR